MLAKIYVTLKSGVHDPQGEAVKHALVSMNFNEVKDVRVGKYIEVKLEGLSAGAADARLSEMCEKLLSNTVIESYRVEII